MESDQAEELDLAQIEVTEAGGAETHRIRQHGVEYRLKVARRTGDDAQHLGGGGLLLSDSRSSLSRRVFSIAMTAWAAKFVSNSICLSLNGRTSLR